MYEPYTWIENLTLLVEFSCLEWWFINSLLLILFVLRTGVFSTNEILERRPTCKTHKGRCCGRRGPALDSFSLVPLSLPYLYLGTFVVALRSENHCVRPLQDRTVN